MAVKANEANKAKADEAKEANVSIEAIRPRPTRL